jgi:hypothetical protein
LQEFLLVQFDVAEMLVSFYEVLQFAEQEKVWEQQERMVQSLQVLVLEQQEQLLQVLLEQLLQVLLEQLLRVL